VDDGKWGSVNLDDDIPLDPENISEWPGVVSLVRGTFQRCGHLVDTYDVAPMRFDAYSVNVLLLKLSEFTPDRTWGLARKIMLGLRSLKHYWQVRIEIIGGPAETFSGTETMPIPIGPATPRKSSTEQRCKRGASEAEVAALGR